MKAEEVHKWVQQLQRDEQALRYRLSIVQKELAARAAGSRGGAIGVDPEQLANMDKERDAKLQELAALREQHDKVGRTLVELQEVANLYLHRMSKRVPFGTSALLFLAGRLLR